jgi:putative heme-binding domain-containing protein
MGTPKHRDRLLTRLGELPLASLPLPQQLGLLRAYALVLERLGNLPNEQRDNLIAKLDPLLPASDANVCSEVLRLLTYLRAPSAAAKGMQLLTDRGLGKPISWNGIEDQNEKKGSTLKRISNNPPPTDAIDIAFTLRHVRLGWTPELRRQYFTFLNIAAKGSGGASYPGYLTNIRKDALASCSNSERLALMDLTDENFNPVPDFPIEPPTGPGQQWTLEVALAAMQESSPKRFSFEQGRSLFHAVSCGACHRFSGLGGGVGPDLTSVANKFDTRYLLESIIDPSKNISDQYQASSVLLSDGRVLNGLVVEQDGAILVYPSDPKTETVRVQRSDIEQLKPSAISQMPTALLNRLNANELHNLVAYIMSGGDPGHKVYRSGRRQ